ncbi:MULTISPECIES: fibronectin type III domain-containing protein [Thermodesulfovibrio]|jgi:fibronectin type 3 domain-containing protein|uniref:fibronectin type III domain-containing protein n=1 Tax=Thermodesulfovibrio TaxID=28261 RepID=UPI002633A063|nr:fibronectin type III domain-containing protein [Thermodesulfovibrio sp.]
MKKTLMPSFAHELFLDSSKLATLKPQNSLLRSSNSCGFFTLRFVKNCYPKIAKSLNRASIFLFILSLLFLLTACGRKLDPNLDDYLQPEAVSKLTLSATYDKILISWSYPEKEKTKIESFLIERESKGEKKTLGYYNKETTSLEDKDFTFGETYRYRIFAIRPKGIYSKPTEAVITPQKLPEVENITYKINPEGVMLSWDAQNSLTYNIYRVNQKGERVKIGSTDRNFFLDELLYGSISSYKENSQSEIPYVITTSKSYESAYMESKGIETKVPIESFTPTKPEEVFWSVTEQGVYISWRECKEKWIKGYRIYRKKADGKIYELIGETMIPLFFDAEFNMNTIKSPVYYKITSEAPLKESEAVEIKVEVQDG